MHVENITCHQGSVKELAKAGLADANLVIYFLSSNHTRKEEYWHALRHSYPGAQIVGCTAGGEIAGNDVLFDTAVSCAVRFHYTPIRIAETHVGDAGMSRDAGEYLAQQLNAPDLRLIFVLSEGLKINGSDLVSGITSHCHKDVILSGGMAADGVRFLETGVGVNALPKTGAIAAIGFYGDKLKAGCGAGGGFAKFGPARIVTRSKNNVLYELDGKNALELYKKYLGSEAENLPGSGAYFPLSIRPAPESEHEVVRSILGIDEKEQSLIFVASIPEGYVAQLMRGNPNNLVDAAAKAAGFAREHLKGAGADPALALLVSCLGRNVMMKQHVTSEIEAVKEVLGDTPLIGFFSYGEICHHSKTGKCDFHNQTIAITILAEPE